MAPAGNGIITCRAAVAWAPGEPLTIEQIQVDPPMSGEVRIKITHTSLCHTDITGWKDKNGPFPRILGHEAAGVVESVGHGVQDFAPGDHVIPLYLGECNKCSKCKSGKTNLCDKYRADIYNPELVPNGGTRFSKDGVRINHFMGTSTFSEYTVLPEHCVAKVDPEAPLDKICLFGCGLTTGLGAVWKSAKVEPGSTVAVFGLGTIGLAVVHGAKVAGASKIIGIDINPSKGELGKQFGLTDFVNPKEYDKPVQQVVKDLIVSGVDYSFECVGNQSLMQAATECTCEGWGTTVVIGLPSIPEPMCINPLGLLFGLVVKGSIFGGFKRSEVAQLVDKYMKKEIKLDEFITHQMSFDRISEGLQLLTGAGCLRCVLHMRS